MQGALLISGAEDVPAFDQEALTKALRIDQAGESTFPGFLAASWQAVEVYPIGRERSQAGMRASGVVENEVTEFAIPAWPTLTI